MSQLARALVSHLTKARGRVQARQILTSRGGECGFACSSASVANAALPPACRSSHAPIRVPSRALSTDFPMLGVDPASFRSGPPSETGDASEPLSEEAFHRAADLTLGQLYGKLEGFAKEHTDPPATVDMTEGKLRIRRGNTGGIQVVKDSASRVLQVNSPSNEGVATTGDVAFHLVSDPGECRWKAVKGGGDLHELLAQNLESMSGASVDLTPEPQLGYGPDPT